MKLTKYEILLLEDLKRSQKKQQRSLILSGLYFTIGIVGFVVIATVHNHIFLPIFGAVLSGGLIGVTFEKFYARKIMLLAFKLYHIYLNNEE
jgi:hypothetical protein